jgi:membrane protein DedA with SNARE-associated domain
MTDWVVSVIDAVGYIGIAALMVLECVFPPIPSEVVLPLAGFTIDRGELSFIGVLTASTAGSMVGAWLLYAAGRMGGRPFVERYMRALRLRPDDLDRAERWFTRRGDWIIAAGRLVPGVRSIVSVPAGMLRMPLLRFSVLTFIGSAVWNAALIGLGWGLGTNWESVSGPVGVASKVVVVLLGFGVIAAFIWWLRRGRAMLPPDGDEPAGTVPRGRRDR